MFEIVGGSFTLPQIVDFMGKRYKQSEAQNPIFYFGPKVVLLCGAASFLFRLFPNFTGDTGHPVLHFIDGFFDAEQSDSIFVFNEGEQFLHGWHNRLTPLTLANVAEDFATIYSMSLVLLCGNAGQLNDFHGLGASGNGVVGVNVNNNTSILSPNEFICLIYQIATENLPSSLHTKLGPAAASILAFATENLNPMGIFTTAGCTLLTTE